LSWQIFSGLAGGIGLFLLGMQMMTDGLKLSAGNSLRNILKRSTKTPIRGILSGALITSMVQSSSAVTVASIGFVNAGLLTLKQAVRIAYGSNLGTTMTGWLVAIIGFSFHIKTFALPMIGVGMMLALFAKSGRYAAIGKAFAGFGLFFLGIDLMKSGFSGLESMIALDSLQGGGLLGLLLFVGVGFVMTLIMQSSSAAIAITLTAAAGGVIGLPAAACMVIGANVGTTSTAALAAIGATSNAKRVAAAHVIFNGVTGVAALVILPGILVAIGGLQHSIGMESGPATFLALFHTIFNLIGVLLMWPITDRMVAQLKQRFKAAEEDEAKPKYLDKTLLGTPSLAHAAMIKELERIRGISVHMIEDAINTEASLSPQLKRDRFVMDSLMDAVGDFSAKLRSSDLPDEVAEALPLAMAATRYFSDVADLSIEIDRAQSKRVSPISEEIDQLLSEHRRLAISVIDSLQLTDHGEETLIQESVTLESLEQSYEHVKSRLLRVGTLGDLSVRRTTGLIELMKSIERAVSYSVKGQNALYTFSKAIEEEGETVAPEPEDGAEETPGENLESEVDSGVESEEATVDASAPEKSIEKAVKKERGV